MPVKSLLKVNSSEAPEEENKPTSIDSISANPAFADHSIQDALALIRVKPIEGGGGIKIEQNVFIEKGVGIMTLQKEAIPARNELMKGHFPFSAHNNRLGPAHQQFKEGILVS